MFLSIGAELNNLQEGFTPGIVVRVLDSVDDRGLVGQTGVIKGIKVCTESYRILLEVIKINFYEYWVFSGWNVYDFHRRGRY